MTWIREDGYAAMLGYDGLLPEGRAMKDEGTRLEELKRTGGVVLVHHFFHLFLSHAHFQQCILGIFRRYGWSDRRWCEDWLSVLQVYVYLTSECYTIFQTQLPRDS
jgi:hypothetical protein